MLIILDTWTGEYDRISPNEWAKLFLSDTVGRYQCVGQWEEEE